MTNFSNIFWNKTLRVSDISSVYHQEFFTVHAAIVYVIQVSLLAGSGWNCSSILILSCPKHIEFHSKINLRNQSSTWFYYKELCSTLFIYYYFYMLCSI
jgi:hypothetical protein